MDINTAAIEMATEQNLEGIYKTLPPKLAYRFRKWMKGHPQRPALKSEEIVALLVRQVEEVEALQNLSKNEVMTSVYDNGIVKMDFGSDVPESVRKAAMSWAKRKGLKPVEASLNKSRNSPESVLLCVGDLESTDGQCVKRLKWAV